MSASMPKLKYCIATSDNLDVLYTLYKMLSLYYYYCGCYNTYKMTMQFSLNTDYTDVVTALT